MHPIPVRIMKFDRPEKDEFDSLCIAGSPLLSYTHLSLSLYLDHVEPFFVKSLRRVKDRIKDPKLYEEADRFARQEAQHYQRHKEFNQVIFERDYPGLTARVQQLKQHFEDFLANKSDRYCIGYIEGFESYTNQFALLLLSSGLYDHPKTKPWIGELFKWHMLEEIEHRNVAFDVYQYLYGSYPYRVRMCWVAQSHMFRFLSDCIRIMSNTDIARFGEGYRVPVKAKIKMMINRLMVRTKTMLPGYSPHNYVIPAKISRLSDHYSKIAEQSQ